MEKRKQVRTLEKDLWGGGTSVPVTTRNCETICCIFSSLLFWHLLNMATCCKWLGKTFQFYFFEFIIIMFSCVRRLAVSWLCWGICNTSEALAEKMGLMGFSEQTRQRVWLALEILSIKITKQQCFRKHIEMCILWHCSHKSCWSQSLGSLLQPVKTLVSERWSIVNIRITWSSGICCISIKSRSTRP